MTVTGPDGHVTQTTLRRAGPDRLDDRQRQATVPSSATTPARTVSTVSYSPDGTTITSTDRTGRTTKTVDDAVGRPVVKVGPTGVTTTTTYDDVANRTTDEHLRGRGQPCLADHRHGVRRPEPGDRVAHHLPDRGPDLPGRPGQLKTYDGIGRTTSFTGNDLTAVPDYAGAGGVPVTTTIAPARTARVQSPAVTATDTTDARREPDPAHPAVRRRAGRSAPPDPGQLRRRRERRRPPPTRWVVRDSYTYAADGRPATRTGADGTRQHEHLRPGDRAAAAR